jgi:D-glycero-alpha-D-manno-heptose-7-phosphate kinase
VTLVEARAPVRVCDLGGWTDTWFAGSGLVCSVAVQPGVGVRVAAGEPGTDGQPVTLGMPDLDDRYRFDPREPPGRHPLLEAAMAAMPLPAGTGLEVEVRWGMPPGSGVGTSASTVVALLGALDALTPGRLAPAALAQAAHRVETERLGLQSGVQDQVAAAHGGINLIEVGPYPEWRVQPVDVPEPVRTELEERLVHVYLGRPHASSALHEQVIAAFDEDDDGLRDLEPLRRAARDGAAGLDAGDLTAYGQALVANTRAQAALRPELVSADAWRIAAVARAHGATGWKVNGAGGDGGSVTLLGPPDREARDRLVADLGTAGRDWCVVPLRLDARGLTVRVHTSHDSTNDA